MNVTEHSATAIRIIRTRAPHIQCHVPFTPKARQAPRCGNVAAGQPTSRERWPSVIPEPLRRDVWSGLRVPGSARFSDHLEIACREPRGGPGSGMCGAVVVDERKEGVHAQ